MADKKELPLALLEIFETSTDKDHILSAAQIRKKLESRYGLTLERRTLYSNIGLLEKYGHKISCWRENNEGYYLEERQFRLSEVRSLLNAVHAAPFLSAAESASLIRKILDTLSTSQRKAFPESLYADRKQKKSAHSAQIYETLATAIRERDTVSFTPLVWSDELKLVPQKPAVLAEPRYIAFYDNVPYVIATLPEEPGARWFRIDRISDISLEETQFSPLSESAAEAIVRGCPMCADGEAVRAVFRCERSALDAMNDRFGDTAEFSPADQGTFELRVSAKEEEILSAAGRYADSITLLEPAELREKMRGKFAAIVEKYGS